MKFALSVVRRRIITLALVWSSMSTPAAATPLEMIQQTMEQVRGVVQEAAGTGESDESGLRQMLRAVVSPRFDFREMARMVLGKYWQRQEGRQEEFVSVFADFVESSYVSKIESLRDTSVVYVQEQIDGGLAQVDTKIVPQKGDSIPIRYKLRLVGDEWKIYDVVVENISLVENYRSQFNRILTRATFDDLLQRLQQKISARGS